MHPNDPDNIWPPGEEDAERNADLDALMEAHASPDCTMGVGCWEAGVCFAAAHGEPDRCPLEDHPDTITPGEWRAIDAALGNTPQAAKTGYRAPSPTPDVSDEVPGNTSS